MSKQFIRKNTGEKESVEVIGGRPETRKGVKIISTTNPEGDYAKHTGKNPVIIDKNGTEQR